MLAPGSISNYNSILLPTAYFPPVIYFSCLLGEKKIFIEQKETFPKQTYRNRCEIMTASGKFDLIVPVSKPQGNRTRTENVRISYREPWQRNHWRALLAAYNSSPYFSFYSDRIEELFTLDEGSLISQNLEILMRINHLLDLSPGVELTTDYFKSPVDCLDLRDKISPKNKTLAPSCPPYPQLYSHLHGFIPGLSILDLIFNLGPDSKKYLEDLWISNPRFFSPHHH